MPISYATGVNLSVAGFSGVCHSDKLAFMNSRKLRCGEEKQRCQKKRNS